MEDVGVRLDLAGLGVADELVDGDVDRVVGARVEALRRHGAGDLLELAAPVGSDCLAAGHPASLPCVGPVDFGAHQDESRVDVTSVERLVGSAQDVLLAHRDLHLRSIQATIRGQKRIRRITATTATIAIQPPREASRKSRWRPSARGTRPMVGGRRSGYGVGHGRDRRWVFHWKAKHPSIGVEVGCHFVAGSGTAIDPLLPAEGIEWFDGRDVQRVVLSNRHHLRDAVEIAECCGCPILCHDAGLHQFEDGGPEVTGFAFGERIAPDIVALEMDSICPEDTVLRIESAGNVEPLKKQISKTRCQALNIRHSIFLQLVMFYNILTSSRMCIVFKREPPADN